MTANGVDLIDENDTRSAQLRLREEIAYPRGPDSDVELDERGAAVAKEGHSGFSGNSPCEQRFARAWRADEQHAARNLGPEQRVLAGIAQVVDDLRDLLLDFIDSGDIAQSHFHFARHVSLRWRAAHPSQVWRARGIARAVVEIPPDG